MAKLVIAAILTLCGLWLVFVEGNLGVLAILSAFGGGIWLMVEIIRVARRTS